MSHPGVGPLTALATVLVLGPVTRFPTSKHVVSYIGLAPAVAASAAKCRLGISPSKATPCSATSWGKRARWRRAPRLTCDACTRWSCIDTDARRPRWPWRASCSSPSISCCATRSTTPSFGPGAGDCALIRAPRAPSEPEIRRDVIRGPRSPQHEVQCGRSRPVHGRGQDRQFDWDAHPRRSLDRRRWNTTSCAAARARIDGWWTHAAPGPSRRFHAHAGAALHR